MTALAKLPGIIGSMLNFADVADRCELTEGNAPAAIRAWANQLAALSPAELGGVEDQVQSIMHEVFKYADIAAPLRGPPMTQDESLPVRRAALAQDRVIRDKLYALSTPRAAEAVTDEMVERLAKYIYQREAHNANLSLDESLRHQANWARAIPEARKMLTAALTPPSAKGELSQKPGPTGHIPWSKEVG